jgi:hypothetical protein
MPMKRVYHSFQEIHRVAMPERVMLRLEVRLTELFGSHTSYDVSANAGGTIEVPRPAYEGRMAQLEDGVRNFYQNEGFQVRGRKGFLTASRDKDTYSIILLSQGEAYVVQVSKTKPVHPQGR